MRDLFIAMIEKIKANRETVGVLGLGYVGLPLAVSFARHGVKVLGFEKIEKKLLALAQKRNYIADVTDCELTEVLSSGGLSPRGFSRIQESMHFHRATPLITSKT